MLRPGDIQLLRGAAYGDHNVLCLQWASQHPTCTSSRTAWLRSSAGVGLPHTPTQHPQAIHGQQHNVATKTASSAPHRVSLAIHVHFVRADNDAAPLNQLYLQIRGSSQASLGCVAACTHCTRTPGFSVHAPTLHAATCCQAVVWSQHSAAAVRHPPLHSSECSCRRHSGAAAPCAWRPGSCSSCAPAAASPPICVHGRGGVCLSACVLGQSSVQTDSWWV